LLDTHSTLIDEIFDLHDRMIGSAFAKAKRAYETSFQEAGTAINEKVRLYAQVGQALIVTLYEIRRLRSRCPSRESLLLVHFSIALKEEIIAL